MNPLEKRNQSYALAQSISGIATVLIVCGCSFPCLALLIAGLLSSGQ